MNLNISRKPEYSLQARHTNELINIYGIKTKLLLTEKITYDENVFGDFQSIRTNKEDVFDLMMLPENSEEFDDIGVNFSEFGMLNVETIRLFVSRKSLETVFDETPNTKETDYDPGSPIKRLISNLVILPNNRVMEITDVNFMVPGINNLFTEQDVKNVYKITLKTYDRKLTDDIESIKEEETVGSYAELDSYFEELTNNYNRVEEEAKEEINESTGKTVISNEDSVFGRF